MSEVKKALRVHQLLSRVLGEAKRQGYILGPYDGYVEEAEVWPNYAVAAIAPSYVIRLKAYAYTGIQDWEFYGHTKQQAEDQASDALKAWYRDLLGRRRNKG